MPKYEVEYEYTPMTFNSDYDVTSVGSPITRYETINSSFSRMSRQEIRKYLAQDDGCAICQIRVIHVDVSKTYEEELDENDRRALKERENQGYSNIGSVSVSRSNSSPSNSTSKSSNSQGYSNMRWTKALGNTTLTSSYPTPTSPPSSPPIYKSIPEETNESDEIGLGAGIIYLIITAIFAYFWVPMYGWVLGIIASYFFPITLILKLFLDI